ncbi:tissue factor pathway inhibitor [Caerostris extrusa]|uniref:Tissue factor pathway inhibitor n=1 Tax=Caerostris extrusa TaxID=172846 RepID=A0AAV4WJ93_CAEEX|nr:tissue factor pathway inhibitor [Caerostris extrusa]
MYYVTVICVFLLNIIFATEDVCSLDPDIGGCSAYSQRYFFNRFTGQCHEFVFAGCLGNNNNFETIEECQEHCQGFELDKSCDKTKDKGPCEGYIWRYFYDNDLGECRSFVYGGCRGNTNNFSTKEQCAETCIPPAF